MQLSQLNQKVEDILIDVSTVVSNNINSELDAAQVEAEDRYAFHTMRGQRVSWRTYSVEPATFVGVTEDRPADWLRTDYSEDPYYSLYTGAEESKPVGWAPSRSEMRKVYPTHTYTVETLGPPKYLVEEDKVFYVYPWPDYGDGYDITVPYTRRIAAPSDDPSDSFFMEEAPYYLIYKAASELLTMNRDHEEAQLYALKAEREIRRMIRLDKRSRLKGDTLPLQRDAKAPFNQRLR